MKVTFEVTQEDIDEGVKGDCGACPIARAAGRRLGYPVRTGGMHLFTPPYEGDVDYDRRFARLPMICLEFVSDFDSGKPVKPFTFEADIPESHVK